MYSFHLLVTDCLVLEGVTKNLQRKGEEFAN